MAIGDYPVVDTYYELDGFTKIKVKTFVAGEEHLAYESIIKAKL